MKTTLVVAATLTVAVFAQEPYTPARLTGGAPPGLAPMAVGGGQVIVELDVSASGSVDKVTTLRSTPPFTDLVVQAVGGWRFTPATEDVIGSDGKSQGPQTVPAKVVVAAHYRAPAIQGPTHGQPSVNLGVASPGAAFPGGIAEPPFPPQAQYGGVVLVEVRVTGAGAVAEAKVVSSAPPFDEPALQAARQTRFRPARVPGNVDTYAYLLFGFPQPITGNR